MIEAFVWSARFDTGIDSVDRQHRRLFELFNSVGDMLLRSPDESAADLKKVFRQLDDYVAFHFADEQQVMQSFDLDPRFYAGHVDSHRSFTEQLNILWQIRGSLLRPAKSIHGFLTFWLVSHILTSDLAMARQVQRIRLGMSPAAAFELETADEFRPQGILLSALQNLYDLTTQQQRDLAASNSELEARVASRTAELNAAYAKLATEHEELNELLAKIDQIQKHLLQSEKMASIGQLAAGVAHEINNPLGFVRSNLGTLGRYADDLLRLAELGAATPAGRTLLAEVDLDFLRSDLGELLTETREGLDRVQKIVSSLKEFSHVGESEWQQTDLLQGLESTLRVVWHEIKYKARIVRELVPLPSVNCMPAQINQVFVNLLINAAQAIADQGVITLRSGHDDSRVWIEIVDTGRGMDEIARLRLFDPFFTTKPVGIGTGLGLSITWGIVQKHEGTIDVASVPGEGTRFRLTLPIAGPQRRHRPVQPLAAATSDEREETPA